MADSDYEHPNILYNANRYSDEQWERIQGWINGRKHWWTPKVHFAAQASNHQPYRGLSRVWDWWLGR